MTTDRIFYVPTQRLELFYDRDGFDEKQQLSPGFQLHLFGGLLRT
jgi:hypothetical protein